MAYQKFNQNDEMFIADGVVDLEALPSCSMGSTCYVIEDATTYMRNSKGEWIAQDQAAGSNDEDETPSPTPEVDLSGYVTREEFEKARVNTTFGESEEAMAKNPGSAFGIAINTGETRSIVDAMVEKGIGLYTFWISKDNADLPAEVKAKNSSCRGLCCVDTVKPTGWYGWIILFDHEGYMYSRYIRNSTPTDWHAC